MRTFTRCLLAASLLLTGYFFASGLALAVFDLLDAQQGWAEEGGGPGMHPGTAPGTPLPAPETLAGALNTAVESARRAAPAPIAIVDLRMEGDVLERQVITAGPAFHQLTISADGEVISDQPARLVRGRPARLEPGIRVPGGMGYAGESAHGRLESWHRAFFAGIGGLYASFLSGALLIALSIWLFATSVERASPRAGAIFRWLTGLSSIMVVYLAISGMLLAGREIASNWRGQGASALRTAVSPLPAGDLRPLLARGYESARQRAPNHPMTALRLDMQGVTPRVQAIFGGPYGGSITVDALSGARLGGPPGPNGLGSEPDPYQFLKRLHRGDFIGDFHGRYGSLLAGLSVLWLLIVGVRRHFTKVVV